MSNHVHSEYLTSVLYNNPFNNVFGNSTFSRKCSGWLMYIHDCQSIYMASSVGVERKIFTISHMHIYTPKTTSIHIKSHFQKD